MISIRPYEERLRLNGAVVQFLECCGGGAGGEGEEGGGAAWIALPEVEEKRASVRRCEEV